MVKMELSGVVLHMGRFAQGPPFSAGTTVSFDIDIEVLTSCVRVRKIVCVCDVSGAACVTRLRWAVCPDLPIYASHRLCSVMVLWNHALATLQVRARSARLHSAGHLIDVAMVSRLPLLPSPPPPPPPLKSPSPSHIPHIPHAHVGQRWLRLRPH
jgi:hypothetical protein